VSGDHEPRGNKRLQIANALVALKKQLWGRGPTAAKTYFNDNWVFCVMEGGLLPHEEVLVADGETMMVRQYRLRFQETAAPQICGAVEEITRRKVLTYHSQIMFEPTRILEMFLLDGPPDTAPGE
jgi:uncharacterized protein YbcI